MVVYSINYLGPEQSLSKSILPREFSHLSSEVVWQLRLKSLNHHTSLLLSVRCTLIANSWEMFYFNPLESTSQIKTLNWDNTRYTASPLNCFPWLRLRNWIFPGSSWSNWIKSCQYWRHNSIKLPANEDMVCYAPGGTDSPHHSYLIYVFTK